MDTPSHDVVSITAMAAGVSLPRELDGDAGWVALMPVIKVMATPCTALRMADNVDIALGTYRSRELLRDAFAVVILAKRLSLR
jgi:altronate dehydratase